MDKDQVTNISMALMAINELSSCYDTPINIHFDAEGRIYIHVGFGTLYRKEMSFYPQDTYRAHSKTDDIYKWVEETIETLAVKKANPRIYPEEGEQFGVLDAISLNKATNTVHEIPSFGIDNFPKEAKAITLTPGMKITETSGSIEHLIDVTCSWDEEPILNGDRLYAIGPGFTREDLTPYELQLLEKSEAYRKRKKE